MPDSDAITNWIHGLKAGEQESVEKLWRFYFQKLQRLVARKLPFHAKRVFDEEDVALSAFQSFLAGVYEGRFPQMEDRENLWRVLALIAARKAQAYLRHNNRQKRGGGKLVGESVLKSADGAVVGMDLLASDDVDPEFAAQFVDECDRLLDLLANDDLRAIALLKMKGHTIDEIAQTTTCTKRAVQRRLEIIRRTWKEELIPEDNGP